MKEHFWSLFIGLPLVAVLFAWASLLLLRISDRLYGRSSFSQAASMCSWLLAVIFLCATASSLIAFFILIAAKLPRLIGAIS